jgi:DNA-binding MarR family transcriptional regulator
MQQLQNASDASPAACARAVLEAVLEVMVTVREKMARRHWGGRSGPTLIHFRAMGVIRKRPGTTLSFVADQLALTPSATSRLVDCLVEKGLLQRHIPPTNRRTVSLYLTPAGTKLLESAMRQTTRELALSLKHLPANQRTALCASMTTLRHLIEQETPAAAR